MVHFRMTPKYKAAFKVGTIKGWNTDVDQEVLYHALAQAGLFWNHKAGEWQEAEDADQPSDLLRIRVLGPGEAVEAEAQRIKDFLAQTHELIEASEPYPCRPPKQLESRVYLTFKQRENGK
jgi:hypothetical protein